MTVIGPLLKGTPTVPVLLAAQVTDRGGLMLIAQAVPMPPKESVTCTVKLPGAVGVPVTSPLEGFSVSPAGSGPLPIEKVYGAVPPVTVIGPLSNGTPTSPVFTAAQVTDRDPLMVIMQLALELPKASATSTVKVPEAVGVPLTSPVEGFSVSPAGSVPLPIEKVYGAVPPVTAIAPLSNGTPTSPVLIAAQFTDRGPLMVIMQPVLEPPKASITFTVKVPAAVGMPVTSPVEGFSVSPAGSVPTIEYEYGAVPPVTVIGPLSNAMPTSPVLIAEQVTDRGP